MRPAELMDPKITRTDIAEGGRTSHLATALVSFVFVVLAGRFFRLISRYAVNIFFSDQWKFNEATLFQKHSIWQMFTWQWGPHRQGLGALFGTLIDPSFRWDSRIESFFIGSLVLAAALSALYLKKKLYGYFSVFDIFIPAVFFIPRQFEAIVVTANFAQGPLPLLLILLYCLAWTCSEPLVRYLFVLVINFLAIYTGYGLFVGFLTPMLMAFDYRASLSNSRPPKRYLVFAIVISIVSLCSFFVGYQLGSGTSCSLFPPTTPKYYIAYMALMFANFFGLIQGHPVLELVAGMFVLIALLASLLVCIWKLVTLPDPKLPDKRKRSLVVASLIAYCLLFCFMTAIGRLCNGLWTAHAPRYVIYLELGMLGLYFHLLNISSAFIRKLSLGALVITTLVATSRINRTEMRYFPLIKQQWKKCYLQTENIDRCNAAVGFSIYPPAGLSMPPGVGRPFQEKLDFLKKNRLNLYADPRD